MLRRFREQRLATASRTADSGEEPGGAQLGPGCKLDAGMGEALAHAAMTRPEAEVRCRRVCSFVEAHVDIARCSLVDVFSDNLCATLVPEAWRSELEGLTDLELSQLSAGELAEDSRAWERTGEGSLLHFISQAKLLQVDRRSRLLSAADPDNFPLIAMTEKKAHEVRIMTHAAGHVAALGAVEAVVDAGSGKG